MDEVEQRHVEMKIDKIHDIEKQLSQIELVLMRLVMLKELEIGVIGSETYKTFIKNYERYWNE